MTISICNGMALRDAALRSIVGSLLFVTRGIYWWQVERQQAEAEQAKRDARELRDYRKSLVFKVCFHGAATL